MFIFSNDNNSYVAYCLSSNIWTFDGTDKEHQGGDRTSEGADPEGGCPYHRRDEGLAGKQSIFAVLRMN